MVITAEDMIAATIIMSGGITSINVDCCIESIQAIWHGVITIHHKWLLCKVLHGRSIAFIRRKVVS